MAQRPTSGPIEVPGGPGIPGGTVRRDQGNPTQMTADHNNPPFIDARIADPAALKYAQGAEMRRRPIGGVSAQTARHAPVPKYTAPVAGGNDVPIPRLDGDHMTGQTMAAHARVQRGLPADGAPAPALDLKSIIGDMGVQPALARPGIIEGSAHEAAQETPRNSQNMPTEGIMQGDTLPQVAMQDPAFQSGGGAMFAVNQPHLARKYGVIRNGQHVPAQALRNPTRSSPTGKPGAGGGVSQDTLAGLKAINDFNSQRNATESNDSDAAVERDAMRGPARGAGDTKPPMTQEEKSAILDEMDQFDVSRVRNAMFKDMLNNDAERKVIEARLKPLDLTRLVVEGKITQRVIIIPDVFEPEFQSYSGEEDLEIKRLLGEETNSNNVTDQYALDKYTMMGLTIALYAINKIPLPDYRDGNNEFNVEAFWKKYKVVSRLNSHLLSSCAANWFWFDIRVRKLFRATELGNG